MKQPNEIYTVGHSNIDIDQFGDLLRRNGITAIADVRSSPFSRFAPHFNQSELKEYLSSIGIVYVFLGKELGARSDNELCYDGDTVNYKKISKTTLFADGINRLIEGSKKYRISMMCSEREPTECHRTILVSRVLVKLGHPVLHILGDGSIESHEDTMMRVVDLLKMPRIDLLLTQEEIVEAAYQGREKQIAYRRKKVGN